MSDELGKYTPEEAQHEASRMQDIVSEGKAGSYQEAEQVVAEQDKEFVRDFVERARKGEGLPKDFSSGPTSSYGPEYQPPFEGYDMHVGSQDDIDKWGEVLDKEAFDHLVGKLPKFTKEDIEHYPDDDAWIFYAGKVIEAPKSSEGRGQYHFWKPVGNAYFESSQQQNAHDGTDWRVSLALKMTPEEKEEWLQNLEKQFGLK